MSGPAQAACERGERGERGGKEVIDVFNAPIAVMGHHGGVLEVEDASGAWVPCGSQRERAGWWAGERLCTVHTQNSPMVCLDKIAFVYLPYSQKLVCMRHRWFLLKTHKYRKMKKFFDNTSEQDTGPKPRSRALVFEMVKNIKVIFGKPTKGKRRKKSKMPTNMLWKKMLIFFKYLLY